MSRRTEILILLIFHLIIWSLVTASALSEETRRKGEMLYLKGEYAGAILRLKEALKENPDDIEALYLLALSLYELGDDEEAKANLKLAYEKLSSRRSTVSDESRSVWRSLAGTPLRSEVEGGKPPVTSLSPALIKFPPRCKVSVFKGNSLIRPDPLYSTSFQPVYALRPGEVYRIRIEPEESSFSSRGFVWIAISAAVIGFLAMR